MHRLLLFATFLLLGCAGEDPGFRDALPPAQAGEPLAVDNPVHTDLIAQVQPPVIDVLWTIDNSCSMSCIVGCHTGGSVTDLVTQNFPQFIKHFENSGVDYHIGVITTDLDTPAEDGKLQSGLGNKWIDPQTTNPVLVFDAMAVKGTGTDGSDTEKGLGAIYKAIEEHGDTYNADFFRENSDLHTIVLSNEDDNTDEDLITPGEFSAWYMNLRTPDKRTFNSLVCVDETAEGCSVRRGARYQGANYIGVTQLVGGIVHDITDPHWGRVLDQLGAQSAGLDAEYFLTQLPVTGTVEVSVREPTGSFVDFEEVPYDSAEVGYVYTETRNSVLFVNYLPEPGAAVELRYELAASQYNSDE